MIDASLWVWILVGLVTAVLFIRFSLWPLLVWRHLHYVFTDQRVILRAGVFSPDGRDVSFDRVVDVRRHESLTLETTALNE